MNSRDISMPVECLLKMVDIRGDHGTRKMTQNVEKHEELIHEDYR
jgi:hypothetical protein